VVVTGACGKIAGQVLPFVRDRYDLALLDIRTTDGSGQAVEGVQIADLMDADRDAYRQHFCGADAVLHFGFVRAQDPQDSDARFRAEFANVEMAYNVYQTAWEEGVRRVVVTSSNHAADYYERLILEHKHDFVYPDSFALSDNYYGWAKIAYETLGFVFASGGVGGRPLENVQIRIGGPRETDVANAPKGDLVRMRRALAVYLSERDMAQLYVKSVETDDIRDENGVPFQIFYGISDNPHAFWSIANARAVIGYEPQDNSEVRFRALIAEHIEAALQKEKPAT
jgi:nucleoside-diphosphate-sugar epimerase